MIAFKKFSTEQLQTLKYYNDLYRTYTMSKYLNYFIDSAKHHKIVLHHPNNGAVNYMFEGWKKTFNEMGINTISVPLGEDVLLAKPTILITVAHPSFYCFLDSKRLYEYNKTHGLIIAHIVDRDFSTKISRIAPGIKIDAILNYSINQQDPIIDDGLINSRIFEVPFGVASYHCMPTIENQKYISFFAGTKSLRKEQDMQLGFSSILNKYHDDILKIGSGWSKQDIHPSELGMYHATSIINLNFHRDFQLNSKNEVNERTFIIPACGGFELTDRPKALSHFLNDEEVCSIDTTKDSFLDAFEYYLTQPDKRLDYVLKGMKKVWDEHTLYSRLFNFCKFITSL